MPEFLPEYINGTGGITLSKKISLSQSNQNIYILPDRIYLNLLGGKYYDNIWSGASHNLAEGLATSERFKKLCKVGGTFDW